MIYIIYIYIYPPGPGHNFAVLNNFHARLEDTAHAQELHAQTGAGQWPNRTPNTKRNMFCVF